jgi:arylsulfatase A-like enzyme
MGFRRRSDRSRRTFARRGVVQLALVAALAAGAACGDGTGCERGAAPTAGAERPRRIVLVTLDTLRFDRLDPAGEPGVMPETRAFAARGAWFDDFWAASSATQPTHATLFTGLHPWEHGVPRNGTVLADRHVTVAERLSSAGFATAAVVASFPLEPRFGWAQGFDVFVHDFERSYGPTWEGTRVEGGRFYQLDGPITDRALALLDAAGPGDQFFWFHYFDPHEPYGDEHRTPTSLSDVARARRQGDMAYAHTLEIVRDRYDEDVARLDASLGRLFRRLDADADRFETHVVLTSDHGESFGEHGALGHGWRVTREQVQAPLVIVSPRVAPGLRHDAGGTADLAVTLLAMAGLSDPALPGRDLARPVGPGAGGAVGMSGVPANPLGPGDGGRRERFYVVRDGELYAGTAAHVVEEDVPDRVVEDESVAGPLRALFARFAATLAGEEVVEQLDPETQEALRALGYLE